MTDTVQGMGGGANSLLPGVESAQAVQWTPFFMSSDNGDYEIWSAQEGQVFSGVGPPQTARSMLASRGSRRTAIWRRTCSCRSARCSILRSLEGRRV